MRKFKVGDKVRFKDRSPYGFSQWSVGVTVKMVQDGNAYGYDEPIYWALETGTFANESEIELVEPSVTDDPKPSTDGGPSVYYDFDASWNTLNDFIEHKSATQWLGDSFHLGNIVKAVTRWGDKEGTTKVYDIKKIIYSGCRVLMRMTDKQQLRDYLQQLLDDQQFKD